MSTSFTSEQLYQIIQQRLAQPSADSYVASLQNQGFDRVIQKVGEEAVETVIAAKNLRLRPDQTDLKTEFLGEISDLLFHSLVTLAMLEINPQEVLDCLGERHTQRTQ